MEKTVNSKKPLGFYFCSLAFTFERFAFYSAKYIIAIFVAASVASGGLGLTPADGAKTTANLVAFTYLAPLIGGYISDHFIGARYLVPIGCLFMAAGYFVGYLANDIILLNLMILLVSIGTGLFKPQTNAITGRLFDDKTKLDNAFSTQYSFVNIGSFIGTTVIGLIQLSFGFRICFLICSIALVIDALMFVFGFRYLGEVGKKPFKLEEDMKENTLKEEDVVKKPLSTLEKKRVWAIILVSAFSTIFWVFWYLSYMPVYYHWGGDTPAANWFIGNFQIPTSWFDSLNALACILLGPLLGAYWERRAKSPKGDLSMFQKTSLGMILMGITYIIFGLAEITRGEGQANIMWIIAVGIILSLGEMVFSPLGNSFISKFSPPKLLSMMMAVWAFAVFISGKSYGYIYQFTLKFDYAKIQFVIAAIAIIGGIVLLLLNKKLQSLVIENKESINE